MSLDFAAYLAGASAMPAGTVEVRATLAWNKILHNPARADDGLLGLVFTKPKVVSKTGTTPATDLARQIVRVERDRGARLVASEAGVAPKIDLVVFGVRDHPDVDVIDTDMEEGYVFSYGGDGYRITDIHLSFGEVQGDAIATG